MGEDCVHSSFKKRNSSNFTPGLDAVVDPEPAIRWIKRLKHNLSDSPTLGEKRSKVGNDPSRGEAPTRAEQKLDGATNLSNNSQGFPGVSPNYIRSWIQRWCSGNSTVAQVPIKIFSSERPRMTPRHFKGRLCPDVVVMAKLRKLIEKSCPCEFQRRGPVMVWHLQEPKL